MWMEDFEKLNNTEQEEFRRIISLILARTFIVRDLYDTKEGMMKVNREYRFLERHFTLIADYLAYAGWDLAKDSQYGVIYVENIYEHNKLKLNPFTTLALYTVRLMYEESRERVTLQKEALITVGELIHKMLTLNVVKKRPSVKEMGEGLRLLAHYNVLQKIDGPWEQAESRLIILPTVLFIIPNADIARIHDTLGKVSSEEMESGLQDELIDDSQNEPVEDEE